tara:strand:+ start:8522 stop:9694 length:1173 start_codon:yes stop_codon:yes gene_type:complete
MRLKNHTFYVFVIAGITFSFLFYWLFPLTFLDSIFTKYQDAEFMDQNFYLFHANRLCLLDDLSLKDFYVTWLSTGVVSYLTYSCKLTGSPMGYIFFNILFFVTSLSIFIKSLQLTLQMKRRSLSLVTIFLLPYSLYLVSLPGKEIFSYCGMLIFTSGIIYLHNLNKIKGTFYIFLSVLIVSFSRPHEGLLLLLLAIIFLANIRITFFRFVLVGIVTSFFLEVFILSQINTILGSEFNSIIDFIGFKSEFDQYLSNENIIIHFLLGPLRIMVICFGTLITSLIPILDLTNTGLDYFFYKSFPLTLRFIEMFSVIFIFFNLFSEKNQSELTKKIIIIFLFYLFFVTFFGVEQRTRYIFTVFPILIIYFDHLKELKKMKSNILPTNDFVTIPR